MVAEAGEDRLRVFGAETIVRLVRDEQLDLISERDLNDGARRTLSFACRHISTASPTELRRHLTQVEEGVLSDGDMDFPVWNILDALHQWTTFLETGGRGEIYQLAIRSIEQVDFQIEADLNDVLASPEMTAEYKRIRRGLTGQP